jgi:hypothetical protein
MKRVALFLCFGLATSASAQDSSFSQLRVRASVLRMPMAGHLEDDWRAGTGAQVELASYVGASVIAFGIGHVGFDPLTGRPAFAETLIGLSWTHPVVRGRAGLDLGARLTDVRMDFDDPSLVGGLRNEEEQLFSVVARGHATVGRGFSAFAEASGGVLMLSTRTPVVTVAVGLQHGGTMPGWLRGFLR